ncbi:MAG: aminotransferase class IV, partial [Thermoguttaceae bacterium]|nr:aminotransferase class IV [Thermoguttaceae bacterium]
MNEPQAWLNGQYIPQSSLRIAATDAGFVQGTAVAEQLRTFGGRLFRFDDHLARLEHSLEVVGVGLGFGREELADIGRHLTSTNHRLLSPGDDLGLSIFVTPGAYPSYGPPESDGPTVALHTYPLPFRFWAEKYRRGQSLVTTDYRQVPPQCWPA